MSAYFTDRDITYFKLEMTAYPELSRVVSKATEATGINYIVCTLPVENRSFLDILLLRNPVQKFGLYVQIHGVEYRIILKSFTQEELIDYMNNQLAHITIGHI